MTFCLDWRLCRFASVAIVPQAFFSLGPCRLQIQAHMESFMRPSMKGWNPRRESRWEFNEHVFLLRCLSKPTDQHKGKCEKVIDRNQRQARRTFLGSKRVERYLQSQVEMNWIIHAHFLYAFLFPLTTMRPQKKISQAEMWAWTPVIMNSLQSGFTQRLKGCWSKHSVYKSAWLPVQRKPADSLRSRSIQAAPSLAITSMHDSNSSRSQAKQPAS